MAPSQETAAGQMEEGKKHHLPSDYVPNVSKSLQPSYAEWKQEENVWSCIMNKYEILHVIFANRSEGNSHEASQCNHSLKLSWNLVHKAHDTHFSCFASHQKQMWCYWVTALSVGKAVFLENLRNLFSSILYTEWHRLDCWILHQISVPSVYIVLQRVHGDVILFPFTQHWSHSQYGREIQQRINWEKPDEGMKNLSHFTLY